MTVSAQTPINRSTGNGVTTVFPYTFKIISSADMEVSVDGVVKTLTVDYTLSGVGDDVGGNVTMLAAPATSTSVVRRRNMALTRSTDYQDQGKLPASTLDSDLDSAVLMIQQVDEKTDRAMVLPADVSGFSTELPTPIANYFLRVNSAGTALELASEITPGALTVTPFIETLLNDSMQADARTTLGAAASVANTDITSLGSIASINSGPLAGLRNRIINGGMRVAQRGTIPIVVNSFTYGGADRWVNSVQGASVSAGSYLNGTFGDGLAQYANNVSGSGITLVVFQQKIESANVIDMNGKTVTLSVNVLQSSGSAVNTQLILAKANALDNFSGTTNVGSGSIVSVPHNTPISLSATVTLGASDATNGLMVQIGFTMASVTLTSANFAIAEAQLELGSVETTFEQRPFGMELLLCQRYHYRLKATTGGDYIAMGYKAATTLLYVSGIFPVKMRATPTLETSGVANDYTCGGWESGGYKGGQCTSMPTGIGVQSAERWSLAFHYSFAGFTMGYGGEAAFTAGLNGYLGWSAEL